MHPTHLPSAPPDRAAVPEVVEQRRRDRPSRDGDDAGMTTAEYAVGTVAACAFAGILFKVLTGAGVTKLLADLVTHALSAAG